MFRFSRKLVPSFIIIFSVCSFAAPQEWVVRSDAIAKPLLHSIAKYTPEEASFLGEEQYDIEVSDLKPHRYKRLLADTQKQLSKIQVLKRKEKDNKVRQDLDILIAALSKKMDSMRLHHQHVLDYIDVGALAYSSLRDVLDARNKPARQAKALIRLRRYVGNERGYTPIATLARDRTTEQLARSGLIGPYIDQVNESLNNADFYLKSTADLFKDSQIQGWEGDFEKLTQQVREYNEWLRAHVLPRARTEVRLPRALYVDGLKNVGVDITPEVLIERATFDYQEIREQLQVVAAIVATKYQLPSSDYRDVIKALKKNTLSEELLISYYQTRLQEIEAIIRREDLITLPNRGVTIRTATEGEAASIPAPFMSPPRLLGNTGEYGEFVIPLSDPKTKQKFDDFSYDAIAWSLSAHEARPGHELQFASMVEQGISIARAHFAFNSANVEGWGVYAEAMILPFMPPEGQLVSLQFRLLRTARAFLDPMINLGQITPAQAKQFLMRNIVLSEPFAQSEVDRYAYKMPGQATAYYYGYAQLCALKTQAELILGDQFEKKRFNDFVIKQGLLPPDLLKQALLNEFVPSEKIVAEKR
ncbi:MAG: DUF885 domain-containing protein [Ottowia sp.]|nr:DUF885 domain-containing protein [Ottowia sp.]